MKINPDAAGAQSPLLPDARPPASTPAPATRLRSTFQAILRRFHRWLRPAPIAVSPQSRTAGDSSRLAPSPFLPTGSGSCSGTTDHPASPHLLADSTSFPSTAFDQGDPQPGQAGGLPMAGEPDPSMLCGGRLWSSGDDDTFAGRFHHKSTLESIHTQLFRTLALGDLPDQAL